MPSPRFPLVDLDDRARESARSRQHSSPHGAAYDIEREIKALGQIGLPRADWIANTLLAAAPQMPSLTLKLHAQPGLRLHHNHQRQV
jgi:hypothetical protein